jgi:hypothetical protein
MIRSINQRKALLAPILALCLSVPVNSAEVTSGDSRGISLTIYNQNFGLVKDIRSVDLQQGVNYLRFEDVAAQIDPTSVSFQSLTAPNSVTVREQNYQYDLLDPQTILSKSVGKQIKFRQYLNGQVRELNGVLLNSPLATVYDAAGGGSHTQQVGLVVKTQEGMVMNPSGEVELAELPAGLVAKPSLLWKIEADTAGKHEAEIAYQTSGMGWKADYVAVANNDDTKMDMTSWVTLDNKSGAAYKNAALKLIAGDVHKVAPPPAAPMMEQATDEAFAAGAAAPQFKEQSFAEYHIYALQGKTDLNQNETKQLSLFNAANVPVKKTFVYEPEMIASEGIPYGADPQKVRIKLEIENKTENQLGMPLPKGKVRVYKKDQDGALQFVGEDLIDHTPRNEKIRLYIGDAFDLVGERTQTNYQQVNDHLQRMSYSISLRNRKTTPVTITAVEHAYGQWKILNSSHPYTKKDSRTFEFAVPLEPNAEVKVNYTIEIKT